MHCAPVAVVYQPIFKGGLSIPTGAKQLSSMLGMLTSPGLALALGRSHHGLSLALPRIAGRIWACLFNLFCLGRVGAGHPVFFALKKRKTGANLGVPFPLNKHFEGYPQKTHTRTLVCRIFPVDGCAQVQSTRGRCEKMVDKTQIPSGRCSPHTSLAKRKLTSYCHPQARTTNWNNSSRLEHGAPLTLSCWEIALASATTSMVGPSRLEAVRPSLPLSKPVPSLALRQGLQPLPGALSPSSLHPECTSRGPGQVTWLPFCGCPLVPSGYFRAADASRMGRMNVASCQRPQLPPASPLE